MGRGLALVLAAGALAGSPVIAGDASWTRARAEHFVLVGTAASSTTGAVARSLERFRAMVEQETALRFPPGEHVVYVFENESGLRSATGGGRALRKVSGAFLRNESGSALVAVVGSSSDGIETVEHELVHALIDAKDPPRWLDEGFAEYLSTVEENVEGLTLGMRSFEWDAYRTKICPRMPVASLLEVEDYPRSDREMCGFYVTSMLLVQHLAEREGGGIARLLALMDALDAGTPSKQALSGVFGLDLGKLDGELATWVGATRNDERLRFAVPLPESARSITFEPLPALERHVLLGDLRLSYGDLQGAVSAFRDARKLAPEDMRAISGLGVALGMRGDEEEAIPLLERAMAAGYKRSATELVYGMCLLFRGFLKEGAELQADHRRARELVRAVEVDRHNRGLHGVVLGYASLTDPAPEALATAKTALETARDAEAPLNLAECGLIVVAARSGVVAVLARLLTSEAAISAYLKKLARGVAEALRAESKDRPELAEQAARVEALFKRAKK